MARLRFSNINGFPCLETTGANLTATDLTYTFNSHPSFNNFFQGAFFVKINNTYTAPAAAVPVFFETSGVSGSRIPLYGFGDTQITTADLQNTGIVICFYDRAINRLQLLTGINNV